MRGNLTVKEGTGCLNAIPRRVLSLFSGCGGIDLGFEEDFNVLTASVNAKLHPSWPINKVDMRWLHLVREVA